MDWLATLFYLVMALSGASIVAGTWALVSYRRA